MKLILLVLLFLFLPLGLQTESCFRKKANDGWRELGGPNKPTSLVVFFKKGTTYEEIESFHKEVLTKPHPEGKGRFLQDGVAGQFHLLEAGYEGVGINFSTDSTVEQRERLKKNIQESPIVYKVLENAIPSDVMK